MDDDHRLVRLLRARLEQAGYQVLVAYDGETALHNLRRERPAMVVIDLMLPDLPHPVRAGRGISVLTGCVRETAGSRERLLYQALPLIRPAA